MSKLIIKIAILVLIVLGIYFYYEQTQNQSGSNYDLEVPEVGFEEVVQGDGEVIPENEEVIQEDEEVIGETTEEVVEELEEQEPLADEAEIPTEFNLAVPFTSQAPHANWELPYQEACEEASAYMVMMYYRGEPSGQIDPDAADAAILEAVQFETDYLGDYLDTTAKETANFIDMFFNYGTTVIENPTPEQIKAEIAGGRPVILPAAGRELGNPNFTGLGPLYHMLVIKGYTDDKFITNDPGTRNGENYVYDIDVIMSAMGDWNDGDPVTGAKVVIFTYP